MHPYIEIAGFDISSYSVMAVLGMSAAMIFIFIRADRRKLDFFETALFFILIAMLAALGAWFMYVVVTAFQIPHFWRLLLESPSSFFRKVGIGFVFYGGLFGILGGIGIFRRIVPNDTDGLVLASVPAIPLFHMFGRVGCYLAGCCYGRKIGGIIVPVQLYEAFGNAVIFTVLLIAEHYRKDSEKQLGLYMVMYGVMRFMLEFLRGDEIRGHLWLLSTSQWLSIVIVIPAGIVLLCRSHGKINGKTGAV